MRGERAGYRSPWLTKKTENTLDGIFSGDPAAFIAGRNALAKKLKDEGKTDEAKRVKELRKPSKAAAVVNTLALDDPKPVKRYLGLADKLRKATSGKMDAKRMRELAREEGELLEELVARAGDLGDGASAPTLDRVRETLQAAQVDADLAEKLVSGRVEREERAASVGLDNLAAPPQASRKRTSKSESSEKADLGAKEKEAKRQRIAEAKEALSGAKAEAREAAREVARAEGELAKAKRTRDAADRKVERAEKKLARLS
ncbi:MAG: hypothetical protein QOI31_379 [Solirubrobacterales bacterium]|jgi:hypothetical protein|nr:hypothetical protein [Solirubrobacterales bacterium]